MFTIETPNPNGKPYLTYRQPTRHPIKPKQDHPGEAKYKRVRLSNPKFQRSVGRHPAALELLRAIGFEERTTPEGEAVMELGRDDVGLLWLGKSALEAVEQRALDVARG